MKKSLNPTYGKNFQHRDYHHPAKAGIQFFSVWMPACAA
jgi:hypothetical protein